MEHVESVRVRYVETDQMGVAYHGQYLVWLDLARTGYLQAMGYRYKRLEEEGFFFMVVDTRVRYRSPARFDDLLEVRTRATAIGKVRLRFHYEIVAAEGGRVLAEAWSILACVNKEGRPQRIPANLSSSLQLFPKDPSETEL